MQDDCRMQTRRNFLALTASASLFTLLPRLASNQEKSRTRIILLGTKGGPSVGEAGRSNPSTLILINDIPYVVDCGYGVSRQLLAASVALNRLRYIFITHHHSDHNLEYGTLFYNAWITGIPVQVDAYGPTGLRKLTQDFFAYQKFDIDTRIVDEGRPDPRKMISAHEFDQPGMVMQNDDVKVSSCRVRHPPITQAYALRITAIVRSVVLE